MFFGICDFVIYRFEIKEVCEALDLLNTGYKVKLRDKVNNYE